MYEKEGFSKIEKFKRDVNGKWYCKRRLYNVFQSTFSFNTCQTTLDYFRPANGYYNLYVNNQTFFHKLSEANIYLNRV